MNYRTLTAVAALAAITTTLPLAAQDREGWPSSVTIGTGSQGGTYFTYGSGFGAMLSEDLDLNAGVEITGGPVQNVTLVETGEHQLGFVTLGPADEARRGESPLMPGTPHENVRALFPMYQTPLQAAVLASSDIQSVQDMAGKRVGVGPAGGTSATYWTRFFENAEGYDGVTISNAGGSDTAGQLKDGLIDAFVYAAGLPTGAYAQLAVENDVRFISMDEETLATMKEIVPAMADFTIPANTYEDQPDDLQTVSLWNFAIAHKDMPESLAYEITKLAMENPERMVSVHAAAKETLAENVLKNQVIPFHPGAVKWFEENGHTIPDNLK
ncbi:TAXI family TRAP transporter solute-binding subunit [Vannielia litorea]|uniref:TAXI family TRAP transporter solute-binding subunit n=1 Tax=Vannielia litorea TaxID=1217970 RepID=UPI001C962C36|nr:TAXI family TRAP transporter solute-binding subunit [Vannielia litorea]MBY6048715.1 TAXI family TRAP transporter solute-binding subunit [Vannielia litorea]MBY6076129.1 TAXI family TRAP transporter solute-binding subunit [Vannielia litorea]